jgi:hypothetical protein
MESGETRLKARLGYLFRELSCEFVESAPACGNGQIEAGLAEHTQFFWLAIPILF